MKKWIIYDPHFNHDKIETYCDRPSNFTELEIRNWQNLVAPEDLVIVGGDVYINKHDGWDTIWPTLPGRKILIRGNHDWHHPSAWWMEHGFDFACDTFTMDHIYFTHHPAKFLPPHTKLNIHGHLHNIWHGFHRNEPETQIPHRAGKLYHPWQRLFAVEYTDYKPVELSKFLADPDKYQARGPVAVREAAEAALEAAAEKAERQRVRLATHVCKSPLCGCPAAQARKVEHA